MIFDWVNCKTYPRNVGNCVAVPPAKFDRNVHPAEIAHWTAKGQPGVVRAVKKNAPAENRWMAVLP